MFMMRNVWVVLVLRHQLCLEKFETSPESCKVFSACIKFSYTLLDVSPKETCLVALEEEHIRTYLCTSCMYVCMYVYTYVFSPQPSERAHTQEVTHSTINTNAYKHTHISQGRH
jgi:hypothetical protein